MTVAYTETESGSGYVVCKHVYEPASSILAASLYHVVDSFVLETAKIWMNLMRWYHFFKSPTFKTHYICSNKINVRVHTQDEISPFSRLNDDWMVAERRLNDDGKGGFQSHFSHHSVTIQSTEWQAHFSDLSVSLFFEK